MLCPRFVIAHVNVTASGGASQGSTSGTISDGTAEGTVESVCHPKWLESFRMEIAYKLQLPEESITELQCTPAGSETTDGTDGSSGGGSSGAGGEDVAAGAVGQRRSMLQVTMSACCNCCSHVHQCICFTSVTSSSSHQTLQHHIPYKSHTNHM